MGYIQLASFVHYISIPAMAVLGAPGEHGNVGFPGAPGPWVI